MIGEEQPLAPGGLAAGMGVRENGTQPAPDAPVVARGAGPDQEEGEPNVSPEEQAAYDEFVETALSLVYGGGKVNRGILELLDNDPADLIAVLGDDVPELREKFSPLVALAATTVIVVQEAIARLKSKPDGAVLMHGGKEVLEDLANLAEQAGQREFAQDEINQAFLHAVDIYQAVESARGTLDREQASQEFASILNAQEQGRLEEVLPGLERGMAR